MKQLTRDQVESRKEKAERFVRNVLGDEDRAEQIAEESIDDYAARRRFQITNPPRRNAIMAKRSNSGTGPTKQDLLDQIADLQQENADLNDQLDAISDILDPADADSDDADQDDDGDDQGN